MDPITHTLLGASLAATPLGRTTRLAAPALIVGANLPDVDVFAYLAGADAALGFRRGWTHGVLALALLPAVLAAALWLWSRWKSSEEAPVSARWLLGLSYIAVGSHPLLDWLNTYGMRWWMPFDDTWYYGDAVFIMDPWLWLVLGGGWLLFQRPTGRGLVLFAAAAAVPLGAVAARSPGYLPVVSAVAIALLASYVVRLPRSSTAAVALAPLLTPLLAALYIGGMLVLHEATERRVGNRLLETLPDFTSELMVGPMPANPLLWDVVVGDGSHYRFGRFDWRTDTLALSESTLEAARPSPLWPLFRASREIPGFLRWARFPWIEPGAAQRDGTIYVMDARYARERTTGFGGAAVTPLPIDD